MNEYLAKKLGEVLAFAQVGSETLGKGKEALEAVFQQESLKVFYNTSEEQARVIKNLAEQAGVLEPVQEKASLTGNKLRSMRDLYLKGEWAEAIEILEWLGFFEGAAIVHWALVNGLASQTQAQTLIDLARQALEFHQNFLGQITGAIEKAAQNKKAPIA